MTWRQFFFPEKYKMRYTWRLTLMRTLVAELMVWTLLFLVMLPPTACLGFFRGQALSTVLLMAWKGAGLWFVPLSLVPPVAYLAIAWHFNRRLSRQQAPASNRDCTREGHHGMEAILFPRKV